ncbi:2Fe-2S iron-sulfur cluster-binding protein [Streptomyces atratus]|uniref:2Fe-2S iron-sulfur cluster-binding protein n=1 Tax=Streptomyces atratus TaxID=1893 RepID=UPI0016703B86|nr:2Fe-2S iron-sulfur cluster-binding protein [Streptomyces atratus]WPW33296.1 2Fe-2S iron-sulfur cluster-binding protein [Streptomyces atratus]GGT65939.1 ferredoxin [Streptomyces atratus]
MTGRVLVTGADGSRTELAVRSGARLMPSLKAAELGVLGLCGGNAACGTCHVYVDAPWHDRLPAPDADEADMLDDLDSRRIDSRLACQLRFTEQLDGLGLTVAPHL